ncbi:hypothetical protein GW17_00059399 [Ensete ventricosum]|nr:hypothetical protein GW17_00059399 [Ensete ventricosum]
MRRLLTLRKITRKIEFRLIFQAPSQKFKILAIPNVLGHGKSYENDFAKKRYGHKHYVKSSFNRFFVYRLINSKFKPFPTYLPLGSRTSLVSRKNVTVINFAQSRAQNRVSIDFLCTVSEIQNTSHSQHISPSPKIQNTGHSQHISPWEVVRAWFREKNMTVINFAQSHVQSRVSIDFSCTISEIQNTGHS